MDLYKILNNGFIGIGFLKDVFFVSNDDRFLGFENLSFRFCVWFVVFGILFYFYSSFKDVFLRYRVG